MPWWPNKWVTRAGSWSRMPDMDEPFHTGQSLQKCKRRGSGNPRRRRRTPSAWWRVSPTSDRRALAVAFTRCRLSHRRASTGVLAGESTWLTSRRRPRVDATLATANLLRSSGQKTIRISRWSNAYPRPGTAILKKSSVLSCTSGPLSELGAVFVRQYGLCACKAFKIARHVGIGT